MTPLLGQLQDFFIGGSNLQKGFDLLIVPDYLIFFLIFLKILNENGLFVANGVLRFVIVVFPDHTHLVFSSDPPETRLDPRMALVYILHRFSINFYL